jgi:GR25 family glycosyltransferase involved in LPS biosynthesis
MDHIHKIIYINLDRRTDRREQIESELHRMGVSGERFAAIDRRPGIVGCGLSHLAVLERAEAEGWENVLVLEDDFQFVVDKDTVQKNLSLFFESGIPYDILMLSYNLQKKHPEQVLQDVVTRALDVQTTSGYLVHRRFYAPLVSLWKENLPQLIATGEHWNYALDQSWKRLQPEAQWFCMTPRIGMQRASYSDIGERFVHYEDC